MRALKWIPLIVAVVAAGLWMRNHLGARSLHASLPMVGGEIRVAIDADGSLKRWTEYARTSDGRLVRHGISLTYHPEGTVWIERRYVDGKHSGVERIYDRKGRPMVEREYAAEKSIGLARYFALDGSERTIYRYEHGIQACPPLVREEGSPPITEEQIACLMTEPTFWQ